MPGQTLPSAVRSHPRLGHGHAERAASGPRGHLVEYHALQDGGLAHNRDRHLCQKLRMPLRRPADNSGDVAVPVEVFPRVRRPPELQMEERPQAQFIARCQRRSPKFGGRENLIAHSHYCIVYCWRSRIPWDIRSGNRTEYVGAGDDGGGVGD